MLAIAEAGIANIDASADTLNVLGATGMSADCFIAFLFLLHAVIGLEQVVADELVARLAQGADLGRIELLKDVVDVSEVGLGGHGRIIA